MSNLHARYVSICRINSNKFESNKKWVVFELWIEFEHVLSRETGAVCVLQLTWAVPDYTYTSLQFEKQIVHGATNAVKGTSSVCEWSRHGRSRVEDVLWSLISQKLMLRL